MTTPLTILPLLIVRPKLLLRLIQSMRTVPTTLNSLATCVFPTTNVPMEPSSLTEQVLFIRNGFGALTPEDSKCPGFLDVCCKDPDFVP